MSKKEIMLKILTATPETIGRVAEVLAGKPTDAEDRRLLTLTEAARELGVSRMTVWRMCADGRLNGRYGQGTVVPAAMLDLELEPQHPRDEQPERCELSMKGETVRRLSIPRVTLSNPVDRASALRALRALRAHNVQDWEDGGCSKRTDMPCF